MSENQFCVLENDRFLLEVCPTAGASITRFQKKRPGQPPIDVFRPFAGDRAGTIDPGSCGCFTMLPYTNRISNGVLRYKGKDYAGFPLHGHEPNALHGDGRDAAWMVAGQTVSRLVLTLDKSKGATPYKYLAEHVYTLEEDGLTIAMRMTNVGDELPFAAGQHPYFPARPGTTITADLPQMELCDHDMQFRSLVPTPPDLDFSHGRRVADFAETGKGFGGAARLDNAFLGRGDTGTITQPEDGLVIHVTASPIRVTAANDADHIAWHDSNAAVIYIPPKADDPLQDYVCVELGMPNIVDEFNLHERGLTQRPLPVLRRGDMYDSEIRFAVTDLG